MERAVVVRRSWPQRRWRAGIERVLLLGSLASGRAGPGSDADLLTILSRSDRSFLSRIPHYIPQGCGIAVDVFPYTYAEIEAMQAAGNLLLKRALAEGIEIFSSPEPGQT